RGRVAGRDATRRRELEEAATRLGAESATAGRHPDGRLGDVGSLVRRTVRRALGATGADAVLSLWREDPHPDHRAAATSALAAAADHGLPAAEMPLWAVHWTDPALVRCEVRPVHLEPADLDAREHALAAYVSQTRPLAPNLDPVLPPAVLAWRTEVLATPGAG
ncbi:MAG: hypothetical protein HOQ45_22205, partial [Nocardioidaceae bacterium]|nr:hypothetical protein [Nocardioidaceae bacterium]